jgi:hypothetical protein
MLSESQYRTQGSHACMLKYPVINVSAATSILQHWPQEKDTDKHSLPDMCTLHAFWAVNIRVKILVIISF